ncbi:hypothetical protein GP486_007391 [Trichoglossum hirsutum]|uniref:Uncharacterized protein n=1 Tax=Trichoglossum hirsutum TaxID=265104 RepID=A0A9P8IBY5_9PEZI|nr:hypothetical protein GP486_007391 [Trichoglossum hirsutum]
MASKVIGNALQCPSWAFGGIGTIRHARSFATGGLHTFRPTSSPELDGLLNSFRDNIFIPSHLPKRYRDVIYKTKSNPLLSPDAEPKFVDIPCGNGESIKYRLTPIDRLKDEPASRMRELLDLMKVPGDFDVIPPFLEGLHHARRKLTKSDLEKTARRANVAGRHDIILECARRVKTTGFILKHLPVAREAIRGPYLQAKRGNSSEVKKALSQAEQIIELLESPAHTKGKRVEPTDPRAQPDIIGVVLAIAAIQASKHNGGSDIDGKVAMYANRMRGTWVNSDLMVQPPQGQRRKNQDFNQKLMAWVPVLDGLRLAMDVLGAESAEGVWFSEVIPQIEGELKRARSNVDGRGRASLAYDILMGK